METSASEPGLEARQQPPLLSHKAARDSYFSDTSDEQEDPWQQRLRKTSKAPETNADVVCGKPILKNSLPRHSVVIEGLPKVDFKHRQILTPLQLIAPTPKTAVSHALLKGQSDSLQDMTGYPRLVSSAVTTKLGEEKETDELTTSTSEADDQSDESPEAAEHEGTHELKYKRLADIDDENRHVKVEESVINECHLPDSALYELPGRESEVKACKAEVDLLHGADTPYCSTERPEERMSSADLDDGYDGDKSNEFSRLSECEIRRTKKKKKGLMSRIRHSFAIMRLPRSKRYVVND